MHLCICSYLSKYLVKVPVPPEFLQLEDLSQLYGQYEQAVETFKTVHREYEELTGAGVSPADLRKDMQAMQEEKEQLLKRLDRQKQKALPPYYLTATLLD